MTNPNTNNYQLTNNQKEFNIHKRIFNFVISVLNVIKIIPKTQQNLVLINQITRSVTSIGANAQEADGSSSRKEFTRSLTIAKKESKETNYWLRVISATNSSLSSNMMSLIQEGSEIEAIISSIVQKTRS